MASSIIYILIIACGIMHDKDLVNGEFNITPKNTCGILGEMIQLNCSLKRSDVIQNWIGPDDKYISRDLDVDENYKNKYVIDGKYNLQILNFTFADAGTYKCEDSTDHMNPCNVEVTAVENHLRITSNISGNLRENDVIEYACDVRYAGNLIPSLIWTAKSQPRIIQNTRHNRPGLAKSVIQVIANKKSYGERYVCTMLFEVPHCNESNVATNVPDCILLKESNPLTVHNIKDDECHCHQTCPGCKTGILCGVLSAVFSIIFISMVIISHKEKILSICNWCGDYLQ